MPKRLYPFGWWMLAGILFGGSAVTGVLASRELERIFFPVVTHFTVTRFEQTPTSLLVWGTFTKVRDCRFKEAVAMAGAISLDLEFADASTKRAPSRVTGEQSFGPWRLTPGLYPVRIVARHTCHPLWDTTTTLLEGYRP